ncbi:MAG: hypothetical protein KIS76_08660 [Pyrinomonadaceae bacterium]|nr:hypothetical protein [Pyrinomonadaceae bacterium]
MKNLFLIFLSILVFFSFFNICEVQNAQRKEPKFYNKIDDIKTVDDIDKLLDSIDKKRFETYIVREKLEVETVACGDLAKEIQAKSWTKADFDNNGYTDILIIGDSGRDSVVLLDNGKNNFIFRNLSQGYFPQCSLPVVVNTENAVLINYYENGKYYKNGSELNPKVLIYKFGDFVEISNSPQTHQIEKIEYKTSGCYGTCPVFELTIDSNKNAIYKPNAFNKKKKGIFKGTIRNFEYDELIGLLNYVDFTNLKDSYAVGWTDDQSSQLIVTYDGGKVKKIDDYGLIGTFGLSRVYKMLFDLRENQSWK